MKQDHTHITVILDRSGSMEAILEDIIGGFNTFLRQQQAEQGTATLTLVQFDSQAPYEVIHGFKPIGEIPPLTRETYVPRASTPLLDTLGRGIIDLERNLAGLADAARPTKVVMIVVTDGQENSSQEFSRVQVEMMIKDKTAKNDWQFVFVSADLAAIGDAAAVGIAPDSTLLFEKSGEGSAKVWNSLSARTSDYRSSRKQKMEFEEEDRKSPDVSKRPEA
jgi:Mg-chelatase subunit ChlD